MLVRLPELNFIDDKAGKPVGIHSAHRPTARSPRSETRDGDQQMLEWTQSGIGVPTHDAGAS
ncbi:MAG: hypothetical protein MZU95_12020 [Desulfomicrobium escambiense]|nr:hypothetical protein [Desulfomicrobium escambiense]